MGWWCEAVRCWVKFVAGSLWDPDCAGFGLADFHVGKSHQGRESV